MMDLFQNHEDKSGSVECLGQTFPSDEARREHYLRLLAEKLKDPEFRKQEGFPQGPDDALLAMSDPPYYTACPNPWLADFIKHYGKPYDPSKPYSREPFAADVSEGRTDPIYKAHPYHSKVPHKAIVPLILHYTDPGDIVLDGFSGSGMTGVAAQWCGAAPAAYRHELETEWKKQGKPAPKWGARRAILIDLSPVANFIAYNLNLDVSAREFKKAADDFFKKVDAEVGWMYETWHTDGKRKGRINYVAWSAVFTCPNCAGDVVFMDQAYDPKTGKFAGEFECPTCHAVLTTRSSEHKVTSYFDKAIDETVRKSTYVPVEIEYTLSGDKTKYRKKPDAHDLELINRMANERPRDWFPTAKIPIEKMVCGNRLADRGITHYHQFYLPRSLHALSAMWRIAGEWPDARIRGFLKFMVEQGITNMSLLNSYIGTTISGAYYIPQALKETAPIYNLEGKSKLLQQIITANQFPTSRQIAISTASSLQSTIPDNSIDYICTDPPFGDMIRYGDLNLPIEAWHNLFSRIENEVLWDEPKKKTLSVYSDLMRRAFAEYYRVLKPGRWMSVIFHNSKPTVWTALQEAIGDAGFVVADVQTLDRKQGSYNQVTAAGAVKQDIVISAYKPTGGHVERFSLKTGTKEGVWDFIRTRLKQLPVFVSRDGQVENIAERQNYLLFDRMVAFHILHGISVPLSATEFYSGLVQRFIERDGMFFLPDQVAEYDKKRAQMTQASQMDLFVSDEPSDLEKLREKELLKEFDTYLAVPGRRLKEFRLEVLRAGFKEAWGKKDYQTIIAVAQKIPDDVLQGDEKLLFWYDQALARTEPDA